MTTLLRFTLDADVLSCTLDANVLSYTLKSFDEAHPVYKMLLDFMSLSGDYIDE